MICMNYDHNKKFGLLKFHSGYETFNLNSPKGYSLKIINAQTGPLWRSFNDKLGLRPIVSKQKRINFTEDLDCGNMCVRF